MRFRKTFLGFAVVGLLQSPAGFAQDCPRSLRAARDGANVKLTWRPGGAETSVRVVRNGTELAAAARVDPPEYTDTTALPGVLAYELTFNLPNCPSRKKTFRACPSRLRATASREGVELTWSNKLTYAGLEVRRGDDVIATIGGDQESYMDVDPPAGLQTYSVAPTNGDCEPLTTDVKVFGSEYPFLVIEDGAVAYWRLDEEEDVVAANSGSLGSSVNGTYTGLVLLENDGLLGADPENTSILLEGFDEAEVRVPDSNMINTGGPYAARTLELWFQADTIDLERRVLYEEGGATRGLNIYVEEVDGDPFLFMTGWNRAEQAWEPIFVSTEIEPEVTYHAVMVLQASENDMFGDFDGRITGYLNGEEFDTVIGADRLYAHGDNICIGGIDNNTYFPDGTNPGDGGSFAGTIDEVAVYNRALDDLDDDKEFDDTRVMEHYLAGVGTVDERPMFHRGDTDDNGAVGLTDAVALLNMLFRGGPDTTCKETQDFDNDGSVVLTDAVGILGFLFNAGPPPAAPGPATEPCGPDPDAEGAPGDLGCDTYNSC